LIFAIGTNPIFVHKAQDPGKKLSIDFSRAGGVATIGVNESLDVLTKEIISASFQWGIQNLENKITESTIYSQSLGEPLGGNAPFSMVALLHQAGRLPLTIFQRKANMAISEIMKKSLIWTKQKGRKTKVYTGGVFHELAPGDIPKVFDIEARLDLALPQDMFQQAQISSQLRGDDPTVSKRWLRENLLNISSSEDMDQEILDELAGMHAAKVYFAEQLQDYDRLMKNILGPSQERVMKMFNALPPQEQQMILATLAQSFAPQSTTPPAEPGMEAPPEGMEQMPPEGMPQEGLPPEAGMMGAEGMPPEGMPPEGMM